MLFWPYPAEQKTTLVLVKQLQRLDNSIHLSMLGAKGENTTSASTTFLNVKICWLIYLPPNFFPAFPVSLKLVNCQEARGSDGKKNYLAQMSNLFIFGAPLPSHCRLCLAYEFEEDTFFAFFVAPQGGRTHASVGIVWLFLPPACLPSSEQTPLRLPHVHPWTFG